MDTASPTKLASNKRILQITDIHLGRLTGEVLLGCDTDQSFHEVLTLIQEKEKDFAGIICTGDIAASSGHEDCYRRFIRILRQYVEQPLAWLPGNHDSPAVMRDLNLPQTPENRLVVQGNWLIVLLNSVVSEDVNGKHEHHGHFAPAELAYLDSILTENPDKHVMVMLHHHPVSIGSRWVDEYILRNGDAFFSVLDRHNNVRALVWGHVHQEFRGQRKSLELIATPSTCVQFKPQCDDFALDTLMPGYRWFELNDDGSFETGVERVLEKQ